MSISSYEIEHEPERTQRDDNNPCEIPSDDLNQIINR